MRFPWRRDRHRHRRGLLRPWHLLLAIAVVILSVPILEQMGSPARPRSRPVETGTPAAEPLASFSSRPAPQKVLPGSALELPVLAGALPQAGQDIAAMSGAIGQGMPARPAQIVPPPHVSLPLLAFEPVPPLDDELAPLLPFEEAVAEVEPMVPPFAPAPPLFASLPPRPRGTAVVAIVIDDLGNSTAAVERAIRLPPPVTLAFLPLENVAGLARRGAAAGHEIFLHMPMQPVGHEDPGPLALLQSAGPDELRRRMAAALQHVPMAVGVNNHMGSRLTADRQAMQVVLADLQERGLAFVDSRTSGRSVAAGIGLALGVGVTGRDVFLDNDPSYGAVMRQLEQTERLARRSGSALAIGHPYAATLQALADFLPAARARGITLVSATRIIALRGCAAGEPHRAACDIRGGQGLLASRSN